MQAYQLATSNMVAFEQLSIQVEHGAATESFDILRRLYDLFARLLNNFKTSLLNLRSAFKRSELKAYHESNPSMLAHFFQAKIYDPRMLLPIPYGMKTSYLIAADTLHMLYTQLNIKQTISHVIEALNLIEQAHALDTLDEVTKQIGAVSKEGVEQQLQKVFADKATLEVPAGQVFAAFDEIKQTDTLLLSCDDLFRDVPAICSALDAIEQRIDRMVSKLEKDSPVNQPLIKAFYPVVYTTSVQFDMMGVILQEFQRVEHNFVLCLRRFLSHSAR